MPAMSSAPLNARQMAHVDDESPFPTFPRVIYQKNPLEFVVCEFRFPAILNIELEVPAKFQEAVRSEYPIFQESVAANFAPPELLKLLSNANALPSGKTYEFQSINGEWKIVLTRQSFSLTCTKYKRWDEFQRRLELPFAALTSAYSPELFVRIGLRYRDLISRERLGLTDVGWGELLQPGFVDIFHTPFAPMLLRSWQQVTLRLPRPDTQVTVQHGLLQASPQGEICYVFDSDFSTESRTEPSNAIDLLRFFNRHSWSVFRSWISDRLHTAMEPEPAERNG